MKNNFLFFFLSITCLSSYACGVHQSTGFSFATEPGSFDVFENVIESRKSNSFTSINATQQATLKTFTAALNKENNNKLTFTLFETTKGHYSDVILSNAIEISERTSPLLETDLLLMSERDILEALASNMISWPQAKIQGLVKINGPKQDVDKLDQWFSEVFSGGNNSAI